MTTKISRLQYLELERILHFFDADKSLPAFIEGTRGRFENIDAMLNSTFHDDLDRFTSFIETNSTLVFEAEVIEERVVSRKYTRCFETRPSLDELAQQFDEHWDDFEFEDEWEGDPYTPEYLVEARLVMVPYDSLKYGDGEKSPMTPEQPSIETIRLEQCNCLFYNSSSTNANATFASNTPS